MITPCADWPVLILNSHYDVVPAATEDWTMDPFAAIRKDGKVYGRGAQDMKCVCKFASLSDVIFMNPEHTTAIFLLHLLIVFNKQI